MSAVAAVLEFEDYPTVYNNVSTASATVYTILGNVPDQSNLSRNPPVLPVHDRLDQIASLNAGWDGHGSAQPDPSSVDSARQFVENVYSQMLHMPMSAWQNPHVSVSESGEIALEWWNGNRKLTTYISPHQPTYIQSWGPHIVNDMQDGVIDGNTFIKLWSWLYP